MTVLGGLKDATCTLVLCLGFFSGSTQANELTAKQLKVMCAAPLHSRDRGFCDGYYVATIENRRPFEGCGLPPNMSTNQIYNLVFWWMGTDNPTMHKYDDGSASDYMRALVKGALGC